MDCFFPFGWWGSKGEGWDSLDVNVRRAPLPGSAEGLVCGGGHQVRVVEGRGDAPGRHQATDVGHVRQQVGLHLRAQLGDTHDTQCVGGAQLVKTV